MPRWPLFRLRRSPHLPPDLISYSPSLPSIFSFLDIEDIVHCQLVSRRWNQLIQRDSKTLLRVDLAITVKTYGGNVKIHIQLRSGLKTADICISEESLLISKIQLPGLFSHYRKTAKLLDKKATLADLRKNDYWLPCKGETLKWRKFAIDIIFEGFRILITALLDRYRFNSLDLALEHNIPHEDDILAVIRDIHFDCDVIGYVWRPTEREELYNLLGCHHFAVNDWPLINDFIISTNHFVKCHINISLEQLALVLDLITKWTKGQLVINYLLLYRCAKTYDWYIVDFIRKLQRRDNVSMSFDQTTKDLQIVLSRVIDNTVLRVHVSTVKGAIEMYESLHRYLPVGTPAKVNRSFTVSRYSNKSLIYD